MIGTLAAAVADLEKILGAGAVARHLRRLEVDDQGEIVLTLEFPGATRWFRARGGRAVELFPEDDAAVPAAAMLAARVRAGEAQVLSWRPGRRIVARVEDGAGARIAKGHRPGRFGRALAAQRAAEERVSADAFTVAPLLAVEPLQATLTLGILPGIPLEPALAALPTLAEVGRRIARLQQASASDLPPHTRNDEIALLARAARRAEPALGSLPDGWRELTSRLEPLASRPGVGAVPAHRDLHDGQILVDGDRFALLDFDLLARAEGALDPANLAVHLELACFEGGGPDPSGRARAAVEALIEGLGRSGDQSFVESFAFHRASTSLRLALLCALRLPWRSLVAPMLARARASLEECERG